MHAHSLTSLKDTLKLFSTIAVNENQKISYLDVKGAFLQGEMMECEGFKKTPNDI